MGKAKMDPVIADEVPWSDHVTEYDEEHFITYLRLLDADAEGARPPYGPRGPQRSSSFSKFTINSYERLQEWLEQYDPICLYAALGYRFPKIFGLLDVGSGIGKDCSRGYPVKADRRTGTIRLMDNCVAHAQCRVKTGLSATADGGFGPDAVSSMRPVATMSLMIETMSQRLGKHLAGRVFVHPHRGEIAVFRHFWSG